MESEKLLKCKPIIYLEIKELFRMLLTTLTTLLGCRNNCSYFDRIVYMLITIRSKSSPHV